MLRARFKDARFFWDFDQKTPLVDRVESLKNVTFQKELGSYHWKTEENLEVARSLAGCCQGCRALHSMKPRCSKAVELAKTDLTTELVKEFTELQGVIGGLYARAQGLGERVALAIYEQYTPASIEDEIPVSVEGQIAWACRSDSDDRRDVRHWQWRRRDRRIRLRLRRAANAIVKILAESDLPLTLVECVECRPADRRKLAGSRLERFLCGAAALLSEGRTRLRLRRGERGAGCGRGRCARCDCAGRGADGGARVRGFCGDFGGVQAHQEYSAPGGGEGICARFAEGREARAGGAATCGRRRFACAAGGQAARAALRMAKRWR